MPSELEKMNNDAGFKSDSESSVTNFLTSVINVGDRVLTSAESVASRVNAFRHNIALQKEAFENRAIVQQDVAQPVEQAAPINPPSKGNPNVVQSSIPLTNIVIITGVVALIFLVSKK